MNEFEPIKVYLETTVVSYLTSRPNRDIVIAAYQEITRQWWADERQYFDLFISELVVREASQGDPDAAKDRLDVLKEIAMLGRSDDVDRLAKHLLNSKCFPTKAEDDAVHIAFAAAWHIPLMITWNMRHLLNPVMQPRIQAACQSLGFQAPVICSPDSLRRVEA
jgi:hypothetical protein